MRGKEILATTLLATGLAMSGAACADDGPKAEITALNGTSLDKDDTIYQELGGGMFKVPEVKWHGKDKYPDDDYKILGALTQKGLADPTTLQSWQLCASELRAQAEFYDALAKAIVDFPDDMPLRNTASSTAVEQDAKDLERYTSQSRIFHAAAQLAQEHQVPCGDVTSKSNQGHYATVSDRVTTYDGKTKKYTADIPDSIVLQNIETVEFLAFRGKCQRDIEAELVKDRARVPDATIPPRPANAVGPTEWFTTNERDIPVSIAYDEITIRLMDEAGIVCLS